MAKPFDFRASSSRWWRPVAFSVNYWWTFCYPFLTLTFVGQGSFRYDGFVEVKERPEETPFPSPPPSCTRRSNATWVGHAILLGDRWIRLSQILIIAANDVEFASRGEKYETRSLVSSRRRKFSLKFAAYERKWLSKLSREAFCCALSPRVRQALRSLHTRF